jgi:acyl-CoA thioester hydrolase
VTNVDQVPPAGATQHDKRSAGEQGNLTAPSVSVTRTVEWVDTDASGHQHNSVVIRWVEAAEAEMMRQLDLPEYFPNAPRVQQVINFTGMLWFGQQTTTRLWVEQVGVKSLTLGFEVISERTENAEGGTAAHGTVTTVWVPAGATSGQAWPDEMRAKFEGTWNQA